MNINLSVWRGQLINLTKPETHKYPAENEQRLHNGVQALEEVTADCFENQKKLGYTYITRNALWTLWKLRSMIPISLVPAVSKRVYASIVGYNTAGWMIICARPSHHQIRNIINKSLSLKSEKTISVQISAEPTKIPIKFGTVSEYDKLTT